MKSIFPKYCELDFRIIKDLVGYEISENNLTIIQKIDKMLSDCGIEVPVYTGEQPLRNWYGKLIYTHVDEQIPYFEEWEKEWLSWLFELFRNESHRALRAEINVRDEKFNEPLERQRYYDEIFLPIQKSLRRDLGFMHLTTWTWCSEARVFCILQKHYAKQHICYDACALKDFSRFIATLNGLTEDERGIFKWNTVCADTVSREMLILVYYICLIDKTKEAQKITFPETMVLFKKEMNPVLKKAGFKEVDDTYVLDVYIAFSLYMRLNEIKMLEYDLFWEETANDALLFEEVMTLAQGDWYVYETICEKQRIQNRDNRRKKILSGDFRNL